MKDCFPEKSGQAVVPPSNDDVTRQRHWQTTSLIDNELDFDQTHEPVWLGTSPNTYAEEFYTQQGRKKAGIVNKGEVKFEITYEDWVNS